MAGLSAGLQTWTAVSEDKTRILINLGSTPLSETEQEESHYVLHDLLSEAEQRIRVSGVYSLPELDLLWAFPWESCSSSQMSWSSDFSRIALWHEKDFGQKSTFSWGVHLFHEDQSVQFYPEEDLHLRFKDWFYFDHKVYLGGHDSSYLEIHQGKLFVDTARRGTPSPFGRKDLGYWESYVFDLETGVQLSVEMHDQKANKLITVICLLLLFLFATVISALIWVSKRMKLHRRLRFSALKKHKKPQQV